MKILIGVFLMALWVGAAMADLTVVQNLETSAMPAESGKCSTMTVKMKGQKARIDFSDQHISSIVNLQSKQLFLIDHKQKQVMVMPLDLMQGMLALSAPETVALQDKSAIKKTGKVQAIGGYTCAEYTCATDDGTTIRCWLADVPEASEMEPFRLYMQGAFKATSFGGLAALKGLIVRSESTVLVNHSPVTSRTELRSCSKSPIADAAFSLPADYKVMEMPALQMP